VIVLDSSALLAYLGGEPGGERVGEAIEAGCLSTVNPAEALTVHARRGKNPADFLSLIHRTGIEIVPYTDDLALRTAALEPITRPFGLSLGGRACLALALARGVTADRT